MNKEAGRGGWLFVTLRLETGEELPFLVDTGSPVTCFDKSLASKLGKRLATENGSLGVGEQESGTYAAPKLFLGNTRLLTGTNVHTYSFKLMSLATPYRIKGMLGMDCLRHYCIQLDFDAGKMRFLDSDHLNAAGLGKVFPLTLSSRGQDDPDYLRPFIRRAGLLGGTGSSLLIDTGDNIDGQVGKGMLKGNISIPFLASHLPECVWDGEKYTNLSVGTDEPEDLGLSFLARHLVTFDFPNRTMYLKRTRIGPLEQVK